MPVLTGLALYCRKNKMEWRKSSYTSAEPSAKAAQENFERVRDCLERSAQRQKRNYDKGAVQRHFAVGDWVLRFYPPNLSKSKLNPKYIGPRRSAACTVR
nr:hypothetical protein BaRGS_005633 [Batillaria attramentaria]